MKRLLPLFLILCLLLCACAGNSPVESTAAQTEGTTAPTVTQTPTEAPTTAPTTEPTVETTVPTVPAVLYRNPLNGSPVNAPVTARPYSVTINNIVYALPMCTLNHADVVIEILAEGSITRCLALYSDISGLNHIGSIRSTRPYLADLAEAFDSIYIHHGGSTDGYDEIYNRGIDNLDALTNAGYAFYRDQSRLDSGYAYEHTSFADGDDLLDAARDREYDLSRTEPIDCGFHFDEVSSAANGTDARELLVTFGDFGKTTTLLYDDATNSYTATQHGTTVYDGNTGDDVSFRNMLFITAQTYGYEDVNNVYRLDITLTGEGTGYFACDGKIVAIRWSRESKSDPFTFTLEDGTPLVMAPGRTYMAIAPLSGSVEF